MVYRCGIPIRSVLERRRTAETHAHDRRPAAMHHDATGLRPRLDDARPRGRGPGGGDARGVRAGAPHPAPAQPRDVPAGRRAARRRSDVRHGPDTHRVGCDHRPVRRAHRHRRWARAHHTDRRRRLAGRGRPGAARAGVPGRRHDECLDERRERPGRGGVVPEGAPRARDGHPADVAAARGDARRGDGAAAGRGLGDPCGPGPADRAVRRARGVLRDRDLGPAPSDPCRGVHGDRQPLPLERVPVAGARGVGPARGAAVHPVDVRARLARGPRVVDTGGRPAGRCRAVRRGDRPDPGRRLERPGRVARRPPADRRGERGGGDGGARGRRRHAPGRGGGVPGARDERDGRRQRAGVHVRRRGGGAVLVGAGARGAEHRAVHRGERRRSGHRRPGRRARLRGVVRHRGGAPAAGRPAGAPPRPLPRLTVRATQRDRPPPSAPPLALVSPVRGPHARGRPGIPGGGPA
ncbi:hypothetical protein CURTO8I2_190052 [Curtobacterium sp. 8I-2]|nr:hypothetical protein CURTO8I2_190052 [Curtobacterium sp. 8I-2]